MKKLINEFSGKTVLFTGEFRLIRDKWMYWLLCEMADISFKKIVSKKLDFVITGANAGPVKLQEVEKLTTEGYNIQVIDEETFIKGFFEREELPKYISFYY